MALEEKIVKKHLYEWLLDHNTITIPQLGKFETTPTSASIQAGVYKFLPPNKKVTFHKEHDATDTTLRDVLMTSELLSIDQANYTITAFVQKVKEALATRQRYELEDFGLLSQLNEDTIIFRVDEETNIAGDSFGLPGLYPKPLVHTKEPTLVTNKVANALTSTNPDLPPYKEEDGFVPLTDPKNIQKTSTPNTKVPDEITLEEKRVNHSSNTLFAALLMVLFFVSLLFVFLLITDTNPFWSGTAQVDTDKHNKPKDLPKKEVTKPKSEEKEPKIEDTPPKSITPKIDYIATSAYVASFSWLPQAPANLSQVLVETRANKFYTVLGSFDKAENAYSFYNNLVKRKVNTASLIAPVAGNTRYRVCLGKYNTQDESLKAGITFGREHAVGFFILHY